MANKWDIKSHDRLHIQREPSGEDKKEMERAAATQTVRKPLATIIKQA